MHDEAKPPTLRLFYALWPDEETRSALARLIPTQAAAGALAGSGNATGTGAGRPISREHLHLTLAFLGDQPITLLPALQSTLQALRFAPLTLCIDRYGYFARSRILWAGMDASAMLLSLHRALGQALAAIEDIRWRPDDAFTPHVTLMRQAGGLPAAAAGATGAAPTARFDPIIWHADRVALVASTTTPAGARYQMLDMVQAE